MNFNKAIVAGNLTGDPELKALPSGSSVTNFSLASNHVYYKDEVKQESVEFHNIVVFGRQAESVAKFLKKGSKALVEGRIQTRSWDGDDGQKRYRTEIVASNVQFGSPASPTSKPEAPATNAEPSFDGPPEIEDNDIIVSPTEDTNPYDIPF